MIESISINDPQQAPVEWWAEHFPEPKAFEFKPGLNILWGKNGAGKSTLLKVIARLLHCEQSGKSVITSTSVRNMCHRDIDLKKMMEGVQFVHDGTGAISCDSSHSAGLFMGAFDDDFMSEGLRSIGLWKLSQGQQVLGKLDDILLALSSGELPALKSRCGSLDGPIKAPDPFQTLSPFDVCRYFLQAQIPVSQPTFIFDEPDKSLDIPTQTKLWMILRHLSSKSQIIIATHNDRALNIPGANYIELTDGYLRSCREDLEVRVQIHNIMAYSK